MNGLSIRVEKHGPNRIDRLAHEGIVEIDGR